MYLYIYISHVCINITVGHCISTRVASRHVDLLDTSSCRQMLHDASRIGCKRPSFAPKMRSKDDLRCLWLSVQRPTLTLSKIIPTALQRGVSPGKTFPPWRANRLFFQSPLAVDWGQLPEKARWSDLASAWPWWAATWLQMWVKIGPLIMT